MQTFAWSYYIFLNKKKYNVLKRNVTLQQITSIQTINSN